MDPKTPQFWADLFWKHFKPQVESGSPVYFAFDNNLIRKLCNEDFKQTFSLEVIKEYFNAACGQLICLDGNKPTFKPLTFLKQTNGFSCSILLVAQQILVVEEMAVDGAFSYDSYFPRYRKRIKFMKTIHHSNPFEIDEFVQIWEVLKKEIQSISGSSDYSITFKEGSGKKNYSRNFPISQALFSQIDLQKLRKLVPVGGVTFNPTLLQQFFDQHKWSLTKRARDKIKIEGLRRALYTQFQSYLDIPEGILTKGKKSKTETPLTDDEKGVFVVSLKSTGFKMTYCLRYKIDFKRTFFGEQMWGYLESFTKNRDIFILTQTNGILGYSNKETSGEISEGDSFILFYRDEKGSEVKSKLDNLFYKDWDKTHFRKLNMEGPPPGYSFYICKSLPDEVGTLLYKSGTFIDQIIPIKERIKFLGGVILDKTQNLYLKNYPPKEFIAGQYILKQDDIVKVNGVAIPIVKLKDKLVKVEDYDSFQIEYKEFKAELKIKSPKVVRNNIKPIGFGLIDDKFLKPLACENNLDSPSLRGWVLPFDVEDVDPVYECELDIFEVAWLMRAVDRTWIPTNDEAIRMVIKNLPKKGVPTQIGKILSNRLFANKVLPGPLINRHKALKMIHFTFQ
jgi:hypothetical protein